EAGGAGRGGGVPHGKPGRAEPAGAGGRPPRPKASEKTCPVGPVSLAISAGRAGSARFHSHTLPSVFPAASTRPPGLNATEYTYPAGPVSIGPMRCGRAGPLTSHSRMALSALPTASSRPSGPTATEYAVFVGPVGALPRGTGAAGEA